MVEWITLLGQLGPGCELHRCARCRAVFYCGPICQRADWMTHKSACKPPRRRGGGAAGAGTVSGSADMAWGERESAILLESATALPFADLEAADRCAKPTWPGPESRI